MINRTKVKESTQIKPGDNGDVLVMKDNAPEWSTPSDAGLAEQANVDSALAEKQDKLTAGDNIHIVGNTISADGKPTPIAIGTVTSGEVPMVSNSGTDTDVVLNFVLPKGDKGDKGDQGLQGPQGPVGAPFQVKKIYDSVEAMNADYPGSDVAVGEFVLIDTGDVQDPDNSKLYVKGPAQYDFVTDLSGAQGIQGPQGNPGAAAGFGNVTATVDNTTGTPQVSVQADGPNTAKNISFSFTGLKGEKGEKGDPGQDGTQINSIAPLMVDTAPNTRDATKTVAIGDRANCNGAFDMTAIGYNATVRNISTVALGSNTQATRTGATALGDRAEAKGAGSVAVGNDCSVETDTSDGISIGQLSYVSGEGSVAVGALARADGVADSIALGRNSEATEDSVVSIGSGDETGSSLPKTRRIVNVTDPTNAQDAATKNYVDTKIAEIPTGTEVNNIAPLTVTFGPDSIKEYGLSAGYASSSPGEYSVGLGPYARATSRTSLAIGSFSSVASLSEIDDDQGRWDSVAPYSVAIGAQSIVTEPNVVSFGHGGLSDYWYFVPQFGRVYHMTRVSDGPATRRLINVTDPRDAQDAATKNYVDTQLEPINAKLQYVPENTNQILSQIQTNVEKAQAAAEAAQTTADGTQASLTTLQNTVNQQAETIAQLQQTVTQLQATINNLTLETERI